MNRDHAPACPPRQIAGQESCIEFRSGTGVDASPVRPRTTLLREGLDANQPYFINEEEVPRAGTRLSLAYNRTRARGGRPIVWLSIRRGTGRGERSSGLAFDLLTPTTPR
jgi:hypothetical protein